ncbi:hypothetical protein [Echinicola rosea]|uniref:Uncharacterized protein n=1 Tax=Echinicola rosea TaxID=1807691 RepID=A0ABQ1UQF3_9BACT|nr:hypothetical protein [Echinicola rosea]GGF23456.1 hypothetical protein GCM10011339_09380 [Echinicola rosea]
MKTRIIIALIAFLSFSCENDDFSKSLKIHAKSGIGETDLWVISTNYVSTFDSASIHLSDNGEILDYEWTPILGEGTFVFGHADTRDTVGYFTNGVIHRTEDEYWVTVLEDTLKVSTKGFE